MTTPSSERHNAVHSRYWADPVWALICAIASLILFIFNTATATNFFAEIPEMFASDPGVFWLATAVIVLQAVPLCFSTRFPSLQFVLVQLCFVVLALLLVDPLFTTTPTLMYSTLAFVMHARSRPRVLYTGLGVAVVLYVIFYLSIIAALDIPVTLTAVSTLIVRSISIYSAPILGGFLLTYWRQNAELSAHSARANAEAERARSAEISAAERARMARELHDISAHHLSALLLHTRAAKSLYSREPQQIGDMLDAITDQANETLDGLRSIVGILRDDNQPQGSGLPADEPRAPVPTLTDVPALIDRVRGMHPAVELTMHDAEDRCPLAVSQSAYRIVQESVTNAAKYASGAPIEVEISRSDIELRLRIENAPPRRSTLQEEPRRRYGVIGMEERVMALGGAFSAGELDTGGWRVTAVIPLNLRRTT